METIWITIQDNNQSTIYPLNIKLKNNDTMLVLNFSDTLELISNINTRLWIEI